MSKFRPTCPLCFQIDGYAIPLEEKDGKFYCKRNPDHVFEIGPDGYLKRVGK